MNFSPHPHRPRLHSQPQIPTKSPVFLSSHYPAKAAGQTGPLQRCIKDTSLSSHEQALLSHFSPLLQNKVAFKRRNNLRFCSPEQREGPRGPNSEHGAAHSPGVAHTDSEGGVGGRGRTQPRAEADSRYWWLGLALGPVAPRARGAIEFCSMAPRSLSLSLDFPRS